MFFNSYLFILLFLPSVLLGYFIIGKSKNIHLSNLFLLVMSILFYSLFNWNFLLTVGFSIISNYIISLLIRKKSSKSIFIFGIVLNIAILGYFKYSNFFIQNINSLLQSDLSLWNILIPVGISFFTFQQLSFLIDSFKKPDTQYPFLEYALHIMFFGYIISGPIVRHNQIIPQFLNREKKSFNQESFAKGLMAFVLGLSKKVLIADTFAVAVNWGFNNIGELNALSSFLIMLGYTLQIYFDFSGYSDMVTGIGRMLNLDIPMNFNSPYKAVTIMDFWKRWHMTLTKFFTDYIYIPLGGSRKGKLFTYLNVFIVFFVSGFWHGANWTFIIWGVAHGVACILNRIFQKHVKKIPTVLLWGMTFLFVNAAWVLFRANSISDAIHLLKTIVTFQMGPIPYSLLECFLIPELKFISSITNISFTTMATIGTGIFYIGSMLVVLFLKNTNERIEKIKPTIPQAILLAVLLVWCIVSFSNVTSFIYVNF